MDTRRRGAELEDAIRRATLDELASAGYPGLTMDGVARRARTGKAALYRRWRTRDELVLDALEHALPADPDEHSPGPVRAELLAALGAMTDVLAGRTGFPGIDVLAGMLPVPALRAAFAERVVEPRLRRIEAVLRRATPHGDIALLARIGPALVVESFLRQGAPPSPADLTTIVDSVLLPLLPSVENDVAGSTSAKSIP